MRKQKSSTEKRIKNIYRNMIYRVTNPKVENYKYYGAKGIKVCDEWINDFEKFKNWALNNGYQDDLTIDRIDVKGNYEPSNCRWITSKENSSRAHLKERGKMRRNLRKLRRDMEFTQEQMGQLMQMSRQAYTNVELGKRHPAQWRWELLFDTLHIPDEQKYLLMKNE